MAEYLQEQNRTDGILPTTLLPNFLSNQLQDSSGLYIITMRVPNSVDPHHSSAFFLSNQL